MDFKEWILNKKNLGKKVWISVLCFSLISTSILIFGTSLAGSSPDEMTLELLPDTVDFSTFFSDKKLNPYDTPYLTIDNPYAVKAKVTSSSKYDFKVKAESDLVITDEDGQPVSIIPIVNLYWQWKALPGWHPFAMSYETIESNVDQREKDFEFDYRIFSETSGLGWDVKPGIYRAEIKYSIFPSP